MCSKCGGPKDRNGRYCKSCHNEYMREWRKTHVMSETERLHDIARSTVAVAIKRGKLNKLPCDVCGTDENIEGHHPDYTKPLEVIWLCRRHHKDLHLT